MEPLGAPKHSGRYPDWHVAYSSKVRGYLRLPEKFQWLRNNILGQITTWSPLRGQCWLCCINAPTSRLPGKASTASEARENSDAEAELQT